MNRFLLPLMLLVLPACGQNTKQDNTTNCPMQKQHTVQQSHHDIVESHADQAMGFPHDKVRHHFRLLADGGAIEITANDASDKTNTEAIRSHLLHIALMFGNGDRSMPMFVHDGVPPGATTMKLMKTKIQYTHEEMPSGGTVRLKSDDPIALASIHDFLRFQINEHRTKDSLEVATR